jgi:ribonuclease BN (tRNA processing enzyme)
MRSDEVILLGSGGWMPSGERETAARYLRRGNDVLLIDAGSGVRRVVQQAELMRDVLRLDIVLTHFHLDHVIGLSYLPGLDVKPHVWAPGEALYGLPSRDLLARLVGAPLFALSIDDVAGEVREVGADVVPIPSFEVRWRRQDYHPHPTLALRLDDELTHCTDTAPDPANVAFASGSDLLFHEAWFAEDGDDPGHSSARVAAVIARDAAVGRLVLVHVNPLSASTDELGRAAREVFPAAQVGEDLASF